MPAQLKHGVIGAPGGFREGAGRKPEWLIEKCRQAGPKVVEFLIKVATGENKEAAIKDRIKAAEVILDRGYGRPDQTIFTADITELASLPATSIPLLIHALEGTEVRSLEGRTGEAQVQ